jgi:hypothetical protein
VIFDLVTIFLIAVILLFAAATALQFLGKFPHRTFDDVTPYLRPAEFEELELLLDPAAEVNFRLRLPGNEFKAWQRKRIHLLREYLLRMSHNALVLIEWGNMEIARQIEYQGSGHSTHLQSAAQELVQAATEFRLYSLLALAKLKLWIIFRVDSSASLATLRTVFGIDAFCSYQRLKMAAGSLGLVHGDEQQKQLLACL